MKKVVLKFVVLIILTILFFVLLQYQPTNSFIKVEIVEKYYSPHSNGKAKGVKTRKSVPVETIPNGQAACLMEFSNGQILEMDCDTYLRYTIGERVKIKFIDHRLIDIRRK
ncbi:hypothetical protein ACQKP0_07820 [Heyndrickxia sp. NPDC080065]|uniref:hypothetical protein n=1 Tax=Heyndrickxia sp. NPDC080065 TaxID=3390568 RepID=UPI003D0310C9